MPPDTEVIETRLAMLAERVTYLKALQETTFDEDFGRFATAISVFISDK